MAKRYTSSNVLRLSSSRGITVLPMSQIETVERELVPICQKLQMPVPKIVIDPVEADLGGNAVSFLKSDFNEHGKLRRLSEPELRIKKFALENLTPRQLTYQIVYALTAERLVGFRALTFVVIGFVIAFAAVVLPFLYLAYLYHWPTFICIPAMFMLVVLIGLAMSSLIKHRIFKGHVRALDLTGDIDSAQHFLASKAERQDLGHWNAKLASRLDAYSRSLENQVDS